MTQPVESPADALLENLDLKDVAGWLEQQRWYASKSRHVAALEVEERAALSDNPPLLVALAQARFATGSHDLYQLPLVFLPTKGQAKAPVGPPVTRTAQWAAYDAVADPELVRELLRHIDAETAIDTGEGCFRFQRSELTGPLDLDAPARPMGVEQSNSSIVFGDETVLKVFRRLEPGINPELELLRFLTRQGFANIAPLQGWYEYEGRSFSATLGVAQRFFAHAVGGWELALEQIRTDPAALLIELGKLGTVTAELHNALASDANDPAFAPEEPSAEALSLLTATIDEDVERAFMRLPDDERVAAIA
jgi:maltokinase